MRERATQPPRRAAAVMVVLAASLLGLGVGALPAGAGVPATGGQTGSHAAAPGTVHAHGHGRTHKEGTAAIAASVIGIVVLGVLIFYLGSLTVRRRMRDTPAPRGDRERGPPRRGLFG